MTTSPPDISSLSLSHRPSQQRLHDTYDYEGNGGSRPQYHFATSSGIPPQSQYSPLSMGQSPLKNKPLRSALPTVRIGPDLLRLISVFLNFMCVVSNGSIILPTVVRCPRKTTLTFLPLAALPLWVILTPLSLPLRLARTLTTRLFLPPL